MKDALGHGSNPHGTHSEGILQSLPKRLTRAHFELIAESLRAEAPKDPNDQAAHAAYSARISAAADRLAQTNPAFDRGRFISAVAGKSSGLRSRAKSRDNASKKASRAFTRGGL